VRIFYAFNVSYREASIEVTNREKTNFEKFLSPSTYSVGTYIELEILLELYFWRDEIVLIFNLNKFWFIIIRGV